MAQTAFSDRIRERDRADASGASASSGTNPGSWQHAEGTSPSVFIVDDDSSVRDALSLLLKIEGFAPRCFSDSTTFLDVVRDAAPACVVLDLNLSGSSPLFVLQQLAEWRFRAPILVISGQSDISVAVAAMKHGAIDYLEKPFSASALITRVRAAVAVWRQSQIGVGGGLMHFTGRERLTRRECDVLTEIVGGASNKEAGRHLRISPRTIEVHRARIMEKLGARNTADLMRIVLSEPVTHRVELAEAAGSRARS